jgi:hypothetical protein
VVTIISVSWVERRGPRLDRAVAREPQVADRLDNAVGALGDHGGVSGQRLACRHLGVDRVALAAPPACVRVRPVDLDDVDVSRAQIAHQSSRVGAGGLDADDADAAEALKPSQQRPIAVGRGREGADAEQAPVLVERRGVVRIGVGVDAARDQSARARHPVHAVPSVERAAPAGAGGQNSDEARVASRFLSSHDRPNRPPTATDGAPSPSRQVRGSTPTGQFHGRSGPGPQHRDGILNGAPDGIFTAFVDI